MSRNEAAERLWDRLTQGSWGWENIQPSLIDLDEALATERRLTVERIRNSLDHLPYWDKRSVPGGLHVNRNAIRSILDDLATAAVDEEE